ncbi:hypothetical protein [Actinomycetospora sp. NBRC 106375]|uniref:hypothetical protein n=1 Tax=Actinomycetospora sp. NBRC 106375 TaxID=3032207 RepID=UPI0025559AEA|nr:hypothetical protein [Actinomycetospora sp. NBRC 106375]
MTPTDHPARHHGTRRPIGTRPIDRFTREPAMTTVRTTPARVRTEAAPPTTPVPAAAPVSPGTGRLRLLGAGLAAGAAVYGITFMLFGTAESGTGAFLIDATGIAFQLGVFCLLAAMWRTDAAGTTRLARAMIVVESVVLGIATVQSVTTLPALGGEWSTVATVLDPFWPLSMLGMAVLGIKVAVAGRWRGALRAWPVVAETWVLVAVPSMMIFGQAVGSVVAGVHFLVGYTVLGLLLAVRPDLTRR